MPTLDTCTTINVERATMQKVQIIQKGQVKAVSPRDAKILVALKKATLAPEPDANNVSGANPDRAIIDDVAESTNQATEGEEKPAKRAYRRKDMQAEGK